MKAIDKERAITTLIRDLELEHKADSVEEAEVIKEGIERGRSDTKAIIDELVTIGVLYRPGEGQIARVER